MVFSFLFLLVLGVSSDIIASYDFGLKGSILPDTTLDKVVGDLSLQGDVTWLPDRVGLHIGAGGSLISVKNITNLLQRINDTKGVSVEIFYEADYDAPSNRRPGVLETGPVLWGIALDYTNKTLEWQCPVSSDPVNNPTNTVELRFNTETGAGQSWFPKITTNSGCATMQSLTRNIKYTRMIHVVMSTRSPSFFVQGVNPPPQNFPSGDPFNSSKLNPLSHFHLGPILSSNLSFVGNIYKLVIYDSVLNSSQVSILNNSWIQNSPPYASNLTINLQEDGSKLFSLTAFDYDDTFKAQNVTCYVTSLPDKGWLTQNGINITVPSAIPRNQTSLLYTPPQYGHGDLYSSFSFYCDDTFAESNNATVFFNVSHVNHAPTSVNASFQGTRLQYKRIYLNGTDVDQNDNITAVRISSLPVYGILKLATSTTLGIGAPITSANISSVLLTVGPAGMGWRVDYILSLDDLGTSGQSFVVEDNFTYSVRDVNNTWSENNATVTITLQNNLIAGNASGGPVMLAAKQSSNASFTNPQTITLPGKDNATTAKTYEVIIESLPDPARGVLIKPDGTPVTIGYVCELPLTGSKNQIQYKPVFYDKSAATFTYSIRTTGTSWSSPTAQAIISITPVQQPPTLTMITNLNELTLSEEKNGTVNVQFFDYNMDTTDPEVGDGYVVDVQQDFSTAESIKASASFWVSCGACVESLIQDPATCQQAPCSLSEPSALGLIRFFVHKTNKSHLIMALSHIGIKGRTSGNGGATVTVTNGGQSKAVQLFSSFTHDSYSAAASVPFTYHTITAKGRQKLVDIPEWGLYCIYVGGSALFLITLFVCVRWCLRCCLCCQRSKKTEPCNDYEAAATDRL